MHSHGNHTEKIVENEIISQKMTLLDPGFFLTEISAGKNIPLQVLLHSVYYRSKVWKSSKNYLRGLRVKPNIDLRKFLAFFFRQDLAVKKKRFITFM